MKAKTGWGPAQSAVRRRPHFSSQIWKQVVSAPEAFARDDRIKPVLLAKRQRQQRRSGSILAAKCSRAIDMEYHSHCPGARSGRQREVTFVDIHAGIACSAAFTRRPSLQRTNHPLTLPEDIFDDKSRLLKAIF